MADTIIEVVTQGPQGPKGDTGTVLPAGGTTGQVLKKLSNADQDFSWGGEKVTSVNGKEGDVTLVSEDVGAFPNSSAGTAATKNVPATGDASSLEVVIGTDSRLTDARTPLAHNHTAATQLADGFQSKTDKIKLDGIESGATADQTGAEIKTAYESEANTNAFTDAEQTKLAGIASGANNYSHPATHAATEIVEDALHRFFTDAERSKLASIEASAEVNTVDSVAGKTGAVTLTKADVGLGSVDNTSDLNKPVSTAAQAALNLKADLSYVDTQVSNLVSAAPATLDTLNELAAAIGDDANFATTVFDLIGTKLAATDYTAADVLAKLKTVDGTGSGLDSETLEGITLSQLARTDVAETFTANVTLGNLAQLILGTAGLTTTGNISVAGTVDGRDVAADGTKLDTIESGATADQTGSEIKTAYEAELDTNAFTDAEKTKLAGISVNANNYTHPSTHPATMITEDSTHRFMTDAERTKLGGVETGATADQTGAEIKTAYEGELNTNAFTDAEQSKLAGIADSANNYSHPATHPATMITEDTTHRFMTDVERTKLNGIEAGATNYSHPATHPATMITEDSTHRFMTDAERTKITSVESGATADQTGAEIKAAYEAELNTNAFTDALKSKLDGIEATATQDQSAAEVPFSNTASGLTATNVQAAIDELDTTIDGIGASNHSHSNQAVLDATTASFTTADETKLDGIESGATADQTGAEIKTAYEGELNTNAFTDAEKTKLSGISSGAEVNVVDSVAGKTGAVSLVKADVGLGSVDNTSDTAKPVSTAQQTALDLKVDKVTGKGLSDENFSTAEQSKLAGIEASANNYSHPATHAATEIVEDATHRFMTDTERTKLSGIEAGATADQTKGDIDALGVDAGTLDGLNSTQFIRGDQNYTATGLVTVDRTGEALGIGDASLDGADAYIRIGNGTLDWKINYRGTTSGTDGNEFQVVSANPTTVGRGFQIDHEGNFDVIDASGTHSVYHAGNKPVKADVGLGNVDNTSDASKPVSTATQAALDGKVDDSQVLTNVPAGAVFTDTVYSHPTGDGNKHVPANGTTNNGKVLTAGPTAGTYTWETPAAAPVASVAGKTGAVTLAKGDVGLGNVDNTSDAAKPVSTAQQSALDAKLPSASYTAADVAAKISTVGIKPINLRFTQCHNPGSIDLDTLFDSGFYDGSTFTNAPNADPGWWYVQVYRHSNSADYVLQIAYDLNSDPSVCYYRLRMGAVWKAWTKMFDANNKPVKADVGLGNVDNTSDANKPVSTAQQTAIDTAINNLLASAPGTLDTLNELAAALGDDPNFATTMTNSLAGKLGVNDKAANTDLFDAKDSARFVYGDNGRAVTAWATGVNSITKSGFYYAIPDLTNLPVAQWGFVLHEAYHYDDNFAKQTFMAYDSDNVYVRRKMSGTWQAWRTLYHSGNLGADDIGLGNVDNTSDASKPISTATQTALDNKLGAGSKAVDSDLLDGLDSTQFLRADVNDTFAGDLTVDNGVNTTVKVLSDSAGMSDLQVMGNGQGTGRVYVGQDGNYGGGIEYNGDNSPVTSGAGSDYVTLYRRSAGSNVWTMRNLHNSDVWEFKATPKVGSDLIYHAGNKPTAADVGALAVGAKAADSELLDGINGAGFARYESGGSLNNSLASNAWVASNASASNVDHIWHDDGPNTWHFCSDTTFKANGNSTVRAGTFNEGGTNLSAKYLGISAKAADADLLDGRDSLSYLDKWEKKTTAFTVTVFRKYAVDGTAFVGNITLPASPSNGDSVTFSDLNNSWRTDPVTITGNGKNIEGETTLDLDDVGKSVTISYINATDQWKVVSISGLPIGVNS